MITLKARMRDRPQVIGTWLVSASPIMAEVMSSFDWDFITLDAEHGPVDAPQSLHLIQVINNSRTTATLIRIENSGNHWTIKRYLDMGAQGVIVPRVESSYAMQSIKAAATYPPEGKRGLGYSPSNQYGRDIDYHFMSDNEMVVVVPQIESKGGMLNLELILEKRPDAALLGPWDLSADMGIPGHFNHPDFQAALDYFLKMCKRHHVMPGIHIPDPNPDRLLQMRDRGFRFLVYGTDVSMLNWACEDGLRRLCGG